MKKTILSTALVIVTGLACSTSALATDGTITFIGEISSTTCTVHGDTSDGAADFNVNLQSVSSSAFAGGIGATAGAKPYSITVGKAGEAGCVNGTPVSIYYEPTSPQVDRSTGNLIVTGGATGVQIQLLNGDDKSVINLATAPQSAKRTVTGNTATLPFIAQYVATSNAVVAGKANSAVRYTVSYN